MKQILVIILITSFYYLSPAQAPDTLWIKKYGGIDQDYGRYVQQTNDGGYIITGDTKSFGAGLNDVFLVKTNSNGDTIWTRTYGGNQDDNASCVRQTNDRGYIIFGETVSFGSDYWKGWLIKTDADGDTSWTKLIGENRHFFIQSGQQLSGGNLIFVGYTKASGAGQEDLWLVKTDASGDTIWTKTIGGSEGELSYCIDETGDGGYIIAASTGSSNDRNCWLIRTDQSGDTIWTKTFGGVKDDYMCSVQQTSDNGFILAGRTRSFGTSNNYYDLWLIKTDFSGDTVWTKTYGGTGNDFAETVQQTLDGGFIIAGRLGDASIIKTNSSGDTLWTKSIEGVNGSHIQQTKDGGFILLAYTYSSSTLADFCLIKTVSNPNEADRNNEYSIPLKFNLEQNYPNPFNPTTNIEFSVGSYEYITLKVYDILGREITILINEETPAGTYKIEFDGSELTSGVYFYRMQSENFTNTKKFILLR
ncbi:MAG: T9SS type A sorting domain-containing protein [Ignavibacteriaceae bacterium]